MAEKWEVTPSSLVRAILTDAMETIRSAKSGGWKSPRSSHITGERSPTLNLRVPRKERDDGTE